MSQQLSEDQKLLSVWTATAPTIVATISIFSVLTNRGIFRVSKKDCSSKDRSMFFGTIQPRIFQALVGFLVLALIANLVIPKGSIERTSFYTYTGSMLILSFMIAGFLSKALKLCGIRRRTTCGASTGLGVFLFFFIFPLFFLTLRALSNPEKKQVAALHVEKHDLLDAAYLCKSVYSLRRAPGRLDGDLALLGPGWQLLGTVDGKGRDVYALIMKNPEGDLHLSFAGSMTLTNWVTNFDARGRDILPEQSSVSAHHGYSTTYLSARQEILDKIAGIASEFGDFDRIHVSGHSLGGGLAQIATIDLSLRFPRSRISTYLFGSPAAGDSDFLRVFEQANESRYVSVVSIFDVIPALANTNYPPLRHEMLIVPKASSAFLRTGHSMGTYYPTLMGDSGSVMDVASLAVLVVSVYVLMARSLGFLNTLLTSQDKNGPFRNSRIGKVVAGVLLTGMWGSGFFGIVKMIQPAGRLNYGWRLAIAGLVLVLTRFISSRWVVDRRLPCRSNPRPSPQIKTQS